ncbi:hypothetical protein OKJ48_29400 [Streptomyces kunmingensis]|uniref:GNAT family N-acetyltransferase n=1 Tax=Streptomyces kunmingensis TaxID=68225 RepID=A0ABU6CHW2_9ACTN|nr:hypothetical protein [Streptomyces kunmingensis]MEB3964318.1 hypothetical protein [Streptomyces kunmingensis]
MGAAEAGPPNTWYGVMVLRGDEPVGMGRVIGDGGHWGELERRAPAGAGAGAVRR